MSRYVFDIEANSLLDDNLTVLHSLVLKDIDSGELISCADRSGYTPLFMGIQHLEKASLLIGHNIVQYDIPALKRLVPGIEIKAEIYDTLVAARTAYPDVMMFDADSPDYEIPKKLWGRHSLEAWGYRTGTHKAQYDHGFDEWSEEMQKYCEQDVESNYELYKFLLEDEIPKEALNIEHTLAEYLFHQERNGFMFDVEQAWELKKKAQRDLDESLEELQTKYFTKWIEPGEVIVPKKNWGRLSDLLGKKTDVFKRAAGAAYQNIEIKEYTGGPVQTKKCLKRFYGWEPDFVKKRKRKGDVFENVEEEEGTDADTLSKLDFPCIPSLVKYAQAKKILGMLSEGKNAWLKLVDDKGYIHGRVNQNGTVTHRCTHSKPNMSQVPSPRKAYGEESRKLFKCPEGFKLIGCDASGLELRMLAHYMHIYDKGAYALEILNGDIHTANQHAAGLQTRDNAKTFIYAFAYGAGAVKIGSIAEPTASEETQRRAGMELKEKFLNSLPALRQTINRVTKQAKNYGYIESIDGRKTYVKKDYKALNCLLQSSGSILVKKWITLFYKELCEEYGEPSFNGNWTPCSYSHDDVLLAVREEKVEEIEKILLKNMLKAGTLLGINIPTEGEAKIGDTWFDVH